MEAENIMVEQVKYFEYYSITNINIRRIGLVRYVDNNINIIKS